MQAVILVASSTPLVRNAIGIVGNPALQIGGEHDAVIVADPGLGRVRLQVWVHPVLLVPIEPGCEDDGIGDGLARPFVDEGWASTTASVKGSYLNARHYSCHPMLCDMGWQGNSDSREQDWRRVNQPPITKPSRTDSFSPP